MFRQIWPTAGRSGVILDKKAQILKILSRQKWGVLGYFGIKHLWGLSGVLSKVRSRSGPAPFCGPRTQSSGPGPAILGPGPGHEYCGVMINYFFIFY